MPEPQWRSHVRFVALEEASKSAFGMWPVKLQETPHCSEPCRVLLCVSKSDEICDEFRPVHHPPKMTEMTESISH